MELTPFNPPLLQRDVDLCKIGIFIIFHGSTPLTMTSFRH